MNAGLTPEERRLIDEAVAAGKVQKIPRGVSAFNQVWDEKQERDNPHRFAWRKSPKGRAAVSAAVKARRERVLRMRAEGCTIAEMADVEKVSTAAISLDIKALGFPPRGKLKSQTSPEVEARRKRVRAAFDPGLTADEIAAKVGEATHCVRDDLKALGLTPRAFERRGRRTDLKERRLAEFRRIVEAEPDITPTAIKDRMGVSYGTIKSYAGLAGHDFKAQAPRIAGKDKARTKKERAAAKKVAGIRDRRRFKTTPVPTGEARLLAPVGATGTLHPATVRDPGERVLKDGAMNSKIGGDVSVGYLKGALIYTLTLEERATCPKACAMWRACYGNSMGRAHRFRHGPELEARLREEVAELCASGAPILIRLHVLGDFYSPHYVALWAGLLKAHPSLHIFGFTAWSPLTPIGDAIVGVRNRYGRRFSIRHSGEVSSEWASWTVDFPTDRKTVRVSGVEGIVCPEQRDAMEGHLRKVHCGSCAACWSDPRSIVFVEH